VSNVVVGLSTPQVNLGPNQNMVGYVLLFFACASVSFILTRGVRDLACRRGWMAVPRHGRNIPTPRLGGVAIFGSLVVAAFILQFLCMLGILPKGLDFQLFSLLLPGSLVFGIGLLDDFHSISPYVKVAGEVVAALILCATGIRISHIPSLFGSYYFGHVLSILLTVFWVLLITNSYNLIDGADGLAAGSALCSTLPLFVVSYLSHGVVASILNLAIAGSLLGFLKYNFEPASIFLGDCGSLFIGFMLSALAVKNAEKAPTFVAVFISSVAFGLPMVDSVLAVARRFLRGRSLFTADLDHIHHRLLKRGLSVRQVAISLYGVSALCGLLSILSVHPTNGTLAVVCAILVASVLIGLRRLEYPEIHELSRLVDRVVHQRKVIANNIEIRRASERLRTCTTEAGLSAILTDAFEHNDFDAALVRCEVGSPRRLDSPGRPSRNIGFEWNYGAVSDCGSPDLWRLSVDLSGDGGIRIGELAVYRKCGARPVLLDINVITTEFRSELCAAINRSITIPRPITTSVSAERRLAAGA
jgi:UDP-GlcNAc:undecaprenyl-phosphate GlcNAc-1-phosphate transferase